jgi:hypothetical protein
MLLRSKLSHRYLLRFLALNIFQSAPGVREEVNRIVKRVYDRAVSLLMEHRETLDRIARALHLICIARLRAEGEGSPAVSNARKSHHPLDVYTILGTVCFFHYMIWLAHIVYLHYCGDLKNCALSVEARKKTVYLRDEYSYQANILTMIPGVFYV